MGGIARTILVLQVYPRYLGLGGTMDHHTFQVGKFTSGTDAASNKKGRLCGRKKNGNSTKSAKVLPCADCLRIGGFFHTHPPSDFLGVRNVFLDPSVLLSVWSQLNHVSTYRPWLCFSELSLQKRRGHNIAHGRGAIDPLKKCRLAHIPRARPMIQQYCPSGRFMVLARSLLT